MEKSYRIMKVRHYLKVDEVIVSKILYDSYHGLYFGTCIGKDATPYRLYEESLHVLKLKCLVKLKILGYDINIMEDKWIS
mgnify:CR=1 FL=1